MGPENGIPEWVSYFEEGYRWMPYRQTFPLKVKQGSYGAESEESCSLNGRTKAQYNPFEQQEDYNAGKEEEKEVLGGGSWDPEVFGWGRFSGEWQHRQPLPRDPMGPNCLGCRADPGTGESPGRQCSGGGLLERGSK
jgi:hypothetical protein